MDRKIKGFVIDPFEHAITEVVHSGDYRQIYEFIGRDCFDMVRMSNGDVIYVDDEGLFRENQRYFKMEGYSQPLAGKGLVLGVDYDGESVSAESTLSWLNDQIQWVRSDMTYVGNHQEVGPEDHPVLGSVTLIRNIPIFQLGTGEKKRWDQL